MLTIGAFAFTAPWLLLVAAALPVLWILLRAIPPAAVRHRFPGVALLLGLKDQEAETATTPWWLLLLRCLAVLALIVGFAGPIFNPAKGGGDRGPLLVVMDGTWAEVPDWDARRDQAQTALQAAARQGRVTAFVSLTDPLDDATIAFQPGLGAATRAGGTRPAAWEPDYDLLTRLPQGAEFSTLWIASPVAWPGQSAAMAQLADRGDVTVVGHTAPVITLGQPQRDGGQVTVPVQRLNADAPATVSVTATGTTPGGDVQVLAQADAVFAQSDARTTATFDLPAEVLARLTRFDIAGLRHAGAVALTGDSLHRQEVAIFTGAAQAGEGAALLAQDHYVRQALVEDTDLLTGTLQDMLQANPDVILMTDMADVPSPVDVVEWVLAGGRLVRFAGPQLAAAEAARSDDDPLLPVRLRAGGRTLGGAMSWGAPKRLRAFAPGTPFDGLTPPAEVTITSQVLAEPGPDLPQAVIAELEDGTPLVTQADVGDGTITLFHVTANAQWSNLPLSGLFVDMMDRLTLQSRAGLDTLPAEALLQVQSVLAADGSVSPGDDRAAVPVAAVLAGTTVQAPPGIYALDDGAVGDGASQRGGDVFPISPLPQGGIAPVALPAGVVAGAGVDSTAVPLMPYLLMLALALLAVDVVATLLLTGRVGRAVRAMPIVLAAFLLPQGGQGQEAQVPQTQSTDDAAAIAFSTEVVFAHVITGDARVDGATLAGLRGLSDILFQRTSVEPATPVGIDLARDELAFFPLIYWPVTPDFPTLSDGAVNRLNRYLRSGGMIVFDTRDGNVAGLGQGLTPEGRALQRIARRLELPRLEPVPQDHVLSRSFYLMQDFPGRHMGGRVWVEAAPNTAQADGIGFRNTNDGVSPIIIGGNDWAGAWATDEFGAPMFPVGRGFQGDRQRELAARFGVNLVMYVLTGNYKSDQVHATDILERMGQ